MADDWSDGDTGAAVPSRRLTRTARLGGLGTGLAGSMLAGGARAMLSGQRPDPQSLLMTPSNISRLTRELSHMRGAAMKLGQLLSMESGDFLPPELAQILARLRDDAQHMPPRQLKQVLVAQYGPDFLKRFRRFDPRPIAAASIGQVHRAVSHDGQELALKIQYPGIREAIDADVSALGTLLRLPGLLPKSLPLQPLLEEARRQLHEEADYRREARALASAARRLDDPNLLIPELHPELSTDRILAMGYIHSAPIESLATAPQAQRDAAMTWLFRLCLREIFDWRFVQTDPNFGNFRWHPEGRVVLLDYGAAREMPEPFTQGLRQILTAALARDAPAILAHLQAMEIVPHDATQGQMQVLQQMIDLALEVFSRDQIDFADTRFLQAMRDAGMQLGMREGFRHIPPWDVLYLQRKLAGLVLLATRLGAGVAIRELSLEHVPQKRGRF